jgi:DNA-binding NarL/FixJ family response regulator
VPVRVVLVDDVASVRETVSHALHLRGGFDVVGEAASAAAAIELAAFTAPDVIVLDLGLEAIADVDLIGAIRTASPTSAVVVFTGRPLGDTPADDGVDGVVTKGEPIRALVDLIAHVVAAPASIASIHLPPEADSVSHARRVVREACAELGCTAETQVVAQLVVSELVTNAITHARTWCTVSVKRIEGSLRVEVLDRGEGNPALRAADDDAESGRGLQLVSSYAEAWGVEAPFSTVKIIWAHIPCAELRTERRTTVARLPCC